jgi:hypothetical protein
VDFFNHWYSGGFKIWSHAVVSFMERLDRRLAFKTTIRYIFHPLYQDRSLVGYALGFIFRVARILIGAAVYGLIIVFSVGLYLLWAAAPLYAIFKIISGLIA